MTKEQEKAIERLGKRIKDNEDYKTTQVWLTDDVSAVYTVLNMLKEKDELYHKALGDLAIADRENIKKDKIIDLMATFIDAQNIRMLEDEYTAIKNIYTIIGFDKDKEGIKQYFERKVKE